MELTTISHNIIEANNPFYGRILNALYADIISNLPVIRTCPVKASRALQEFANSHTKSAHLNHKRVYEASKLSYGLPDVSFEGNGNMLITIPHIQKTVATKLSAIRTKFPEIDRHINLSEVCPTIFMILAQKAQHVALKRPASG